LAKRVKYFRIRVGGRKKSRVKVGYRPILFFILMALLVGAYAIVVNVDLEDRINAYNARHQAQSHGP
jgi:hypothetical protein